MKMPRPAATLVLVVACGIAGVLYAIWFGTAGDGGRGGAVGVALSLAILFSGPPSRSSDHASRGAVKKRLRDPLAAEPSALEARVDQLEEDIVTLRNAGAAKREWDGIEKLWLASASAVATLFWGFGDVAARMFGAAVACCG